MMTFIPNDNLRVGDKVKLTKDVHVLKGTFARGTIMTVTGTGGWRGPDMVDENGGELSEVFDSSYYVKI